MCSGTSRSRTNISENTYSLGTSTGTVRDKLFYMRKTVYRQVLKLGANEAPAQGLQNALYNCRKTVISKNSAPDDKSYIFKYFSKESYL